MNKLKEMVSKPINLADQMVLIGVFLAFLYWGLESFINVFSIDDIYQSSILHDIGKVGIPDAILLKPDKFTDEEFAVIKRHTTLGGDAIKAIEDQIEAQSFLQMGKEIAYNHHEKWDGSGYPVGLKKENIPLAARIVALADVYDALTTKRFYKRAYSHEKTMQIIVESKTTHFDPEIVDAFLQLADDFDRIRAGQFKATPSKTGPFKADAGWNKLPVYATGS